MKIAVSVPDDVFRQADDLAAERGISRSEVYTQALRGFLDREAGASDPVTARLDAVAATNDPGPGTTAARRLIDEGLSEW